MDFIAGVGGMVASIPTKLMPITKPNTMPIRYFRLIKIVLTGTYIFNMLLFFGNTIAIMPKARVDSSIISKYAKLPIRIILNIAPTDSLTRLKPIIEIMITPNTTKSMAPKNPDVPYSPALKSVIC